MSRSPLIHPRTRNAFRDACCDWAVIRHIEGAFENEGFQEAADDEAPSGNWYDRGGQRRGTFDRFVHDVDWAKSSHVRRVLNVFEEILSQAPTSEAGDKLLRLLERDGYRIENGRILGTPLVALEIPLDGIRTAAAVMDHLQRIARTADSDPAQAISGAKSLIETTTKIVLDELNQPYGKKDDIPALVKKAQRALALDPRDVAPSKQGAPAGAAVTSVALAWRTRRRGRRGQVAGRGTEPTWRSRRSRSDSPPPASFSRGLVTVRSGFSGMRT